MLSINFEPLASERPDLTDALKAIRDWCNHHEEVNYIDPRRVAAEAHLPPLRLVTVLQELVDTGYLQPIFRFETPAGYMLPGGFQAFVDIPDELTDTRTNLPVNRWDGTIVPMFQPIDRGVGK